MIHRVYSDEYNKKIFANKKTLVKSLHLSTLVTESFVVLKRASVV